jgi:hypothetical protein
MELRSQESGVRIQNSGVRIQESNHTPAYGTALFTPWDEGWRGIFTFLAL